MSDVKMVLVVRKDLNMRKGKIAAQASHAAVGAVLQSIFGERLDDSSFGIDGEGFEITKPTFVNKNTKDWLLGTFTKICVSVDSEEELDAVAKKAEEAGINCCVITDNGLTEFHGVKTKTCLALGPCKSKELDKITGELKLL